MELRQLRYFVAIARHGSFSAASLHIGVAQPALSTQIANLEKEIGQPLFDRHARGARMTDAGETFLDHAVAILQRVDEARLALRPKVLPGATEITIGVPPLISMMLTVPLVEAVARDLPGVSLKIIEGMSGALRGWLADGSLDLAFLHNVDREEFPNAVPIIRENLFAAASAIAMPPAAFRKLRRSRRFVSSGLIMVPPTESAARCADIITPCADHKDRLAPVRHRWAHSRLCSGVWP